MYGISSSQVSTDIRVFKTRNGVEIFRIPLEVFPGFWAYSYYIDIHKNMKVLIDTGSGFNNSNEHLVDGFAKISELQNKQVNLGTLTHIFITHGHIDHFGGLPFLQENSTAKTYIHELDSRIVTNHEERRIIVAERLREFLVQAGVDKDELKFLMDLYNLSKLNFESSRIDFTYEEEGMRIGPFDFIHVPGHCPGHVIIRLDDVLFTGDHIMMETSPHQAPERLSLNTGLTHYIESLEEVRRLDGEISLGLSGHKDPILSIRERVREIRELHEERLEEILGLLMKPLTVSEISHQLFGNVEGYNILLAIEETGAHVEYLYQRGLIRIDNINEVKNHNLVPLKYILQEQEQI